MIVLNRHMIIPKKIRNETKTRYLVPLGKKYLGVCGRMPGDPKDQIDFTKEGNTIGTTLHIKFICNNRITLFLEA